LSPRTWRIGAKAVSIYRDGSKRPQPLNTSKAAIVAAGVLTAAVAIAGPVRRKLPDERHAITHKFDIAGHEGYITVGLYEDGMPGEIFLVMAKEGSTISGFADAFAQAISCALQYGVPLQDLVDSYIASSQSSLPELNPLKSLLNVFQSTPPVILELAANV
jgi:ribonucleoside-diphosphate reductase alpha chain